MTEGLPPFLIFVINYFVYFSARSRFYACPSVGHKPCNFVCCNMLIYCAEFQVRRVIQAAPETAVFPAYEDRPVRPASEVQTASQDLMDRQVSFTEYSRNFCFV